MCSICTNQWWVDWSLYQCVRSWLIGQSHVLHICCWWWTQSHPVAHGLKMEKGPPRKNQNKVIHGGGMDAGKNSLSTQNKSIYHFPFLLFTFKLEWLEWLQEYLILLHFILLYFIDDVCVFFHKLMARPSISKKITTHFIAIFPLLLWSGTGPTAPPRYACTLISLKSRENNFFSDWVLSPHLGARSLMLVSCSDSFYRIFLN